MTKDQLKSADPMCRDCKFLVWSDRYGPDCPHWGQMKYTQCDYYKKELHTEKNYELKEILLLLFS